MKFSEVHKTITKMIEKLRNKGKIAYVTNTLTNFTKILEIVIELVLNII